MLPKSTRDIPEASVEDETSLDCEASFSLKFKKVKVEPKLRFLLLTYVLLTTLFGQNHLLLALGKAFLFFFGE